MSLIFPEISVQLHTSWPHWSQTQKSWYIFCVFNENRLLNGQLMTILKSIFIQLCIFLRLFGTSKLCHLSIDLKKSVFYLKGYNWSKTFHFFGGLCLWSQFTKRLRSLRSPKNKHKLKQLNVLIYILFRASYPKDKSRPYY